jgi:hypothetical protein
LVAQRIARTLGDLPRQYPAGIRVLEEVSEALSAEYLSLGIEGSELREVP